MSDSSLRAQDVTVLVVDDEPDVAEFLSSVLEDAGMRVLIASDGDEALKLIRRETPDLISLDLVMPRKSGIRVLMELRRHREWSRIPVIIVTAHTVGTDVRRDLDEVLSESTMAGPSLYLEKPVTAQGYLESVCQVLGIEPPPKLDDDRADSALRDEALELIRSADSRTLEAVVGALKREK